MHDNAQKSVGEGDVKRWIKLIDATRKHDEEARLRYAEDRKIARGDTGYEVAANVAGTLIDIIKSYLYAKNPDVSARGKVKIVKDGSEIIEIAESMIAEDPALAMAAEQAAINAIELGLDEVSAGQASKQVVDKKYEELLNQAVKSIKNINQQKAHDFKRWGQSIEIVVSDLWNKAELKRRAKPFVSSALTIGVGWLKCVWLERTASDPAVTKQIADLQNNINSAALLREKMNEDDATESDALVADYERQLKALDGKSEVPVSRGLVIEVVPGENMTVAAGYALPDYKDAPWMSEEIFLDFDFVQAECKIPTQRMDKATKYYPKKPVLSRDLSKEPFGARSTADDASQFSEQDSEGKDMRPLACMVLIYDRASNHLLTAVRGIEDGWAKEPVEPCASSRFYPYFGFFTGVVDGQRHPQSMITRAKSLLEEYDRIGTDETKVRMSANPGLMFDGSAISPEYVDAVTNSKIGDNTNMKLVNEDRPMNTVFFPKPTPVIDYNLYDRSRIMNEIERIFGVQEALSQGISTEKTATEADIQQQGFNSRVGYRRDDLDEVLSELAEYTATIAHQYMDEEDVKKIAGDDAVWPRYKGPESISDRMTVSIKASSSGKPNTSSERDSWLQFAPQLNNAILQTQQMLFSSPEDTAECLKLALQTTADRLGENINVEDMLPKAGSPPPMQ